MAEACATSCANNLASKLGEYLIALIGRQFGYVLCYKSYVEDLKNGVKKLETARERVQRLVDEAMYDRKPIHTDVKNWLESVDNKAKEAENLLNQGENANISCFHGWLPNPMVRHPIGRKVKKMTRVIQGLHDESMNSNFQKVYCENTPIGIVAATTSATRSVDNEEDVLESRASIIEDVMKAIADDKVRVIGVHGLGGVGKSKLLEDIERQVKKEKLFDVVAKANVSRNPNIKTIQGELAYALGLKLMNEETARGRADLLCKRIESGPNKNILIILDNLWKKLDLNEVGIPCGYDNKVRGCKLLLTSRYRDVLLIDMGSDGEFRLDKLEDREARRLFERTVGDKVNNPKFKPLVDRVVKNCGGLPLVIVSLAKRLKHGDLPAWTNALAKIEGPEVKSIVELNYNDLKDDRIRLLFLVCALACGRINIHDSLVYCMGLGLYKEYSNTIKNARDKLIMDLCSLQDSSLLLDSDDMEMFQMHDIFVDVAISIAPIAEWSTLVTRKDYGFKEWSKDELRKCTAISSPFVGINELPKKLDCPNLRMLLLLEENSSLKIPESFFESMEKLQVLDFTGLSFTSLPSSIEFLGNLKSLCLDWCYLEDVTILGKLKGLQFLSLVGSAVTRLPKEISELTELRFLDLKMCTRLNVIEPGVLESLVNLEELYMEDSFDQWEAEDEFPRSNASIAELKNMKKLSTLYIAIPHSTILLRDLPFGKLNKHKIQIGDVWDWSDECRESKTLKLKLDSGNLLHEEWLQSCLQITEDLHLDGLQYGSNSIHNLCIEGFQELKHLHVQNSPSIAYVVHSILNVQCIAFTRLESLFLENLKHLEKICQAYLAPESFSNLKIVKVDNCGEIKHLFPSSLTKVFLQLKEIEINTCHLMQQIVVDSEADDVEHEIDDDPKVKSCDLQVLTLRNLPRMTSFWKTMDHSIVFFNGQQVSMPRLESLTLSELPKLKEIWSSQLPSNMCNLKFLQVKECLSLLSIIPSSMLIKLQNLEAITIERCQLIQEVFNLEGLATRGDDKILSRLTKLTLSDLPSLGCLWNKNPRRALCFQNLRALKVQNCENLRSLFTSSMAKALKQIKEIEIASCKQMEEIMDMQEEESKEATTTNIVEFPLLTSLSLDELPNLRTFFSGKYHVHCPSLTKLRISGCPKMMTFFSSEGQQQSMTATTSSQETFGHINYDFSLLAFFNQNVFFPSLEELTLLSLCGLRRIWSSDLPEESFSRLASITVGDCENLAHIFPTTLIEMFKSLKTIEVFKCASLEALVEHVVVDPKKRQKSLVLLVKEMKLWHLSRLNALVRSSTKATLSLPSLTNLSLRTCHSLRYLFTDDTARTLEKLEMLDVSDCDNMQEVVAVEEGEEHNLKEVNFSHLCTLRLCSLKSLISFSSRSCACEFPSLKEFTVEECKAVVVIVGDASCKKLKDNIPMQQPLLLIEKVEFPNMESMKISHMDNVEKIWLDELVSNAFRNLKTLIVEHCEKLSSIFSSETILAGFRNLEKLVVTKCDSLEVVFHIQELNMSEAHLASTFQLRELNLERLPKMKHVWSGHPRGTITFEYLQCLHVDKCESLQSLFPSSVAKSMAQLEELVICDGGVEEIIAEEDREVGTSASDLFFPRLTNLKMDELRELRSFLKNSHTSHWPLLKKLQVRHCNKMRSFSFACEIQSCQGIVSNMNRPALFPFEKVAPQLEKLRLAREDVVMMPQHYIFGKLRELTVGCYHDENVAFPSNFLLQRFPKLELLSVVCSSFDEIFPEDVFGHNGASLKALGSLKQIRLNNLCNLRRVWKDGSLMAKILKQIERLFVWQCPSLSNIFPSLCSFRSLMELQVEDCAGLVHMGTCSAVKSLVRLNRLILVNCGSMEDVVTNDGNRAEEISFPKLQMLALDGLPSLESFSPTNCAFRFPSLVCIIVKQCPKINIFCKGALRTPKLDKVLLSQEDDKGHWEGDLNTTIQNLSTRNRPHQIH